MTNAQFETVSIVPNTYHHPQRDIDTVVHEDAVAENGQLDHFEQVLESPWRSSESGGSDPVAQAQEKCSSVSSTVAATDSPGRRIQG